MTPTRSTLSTLVVIGALAMPAPPALAVPGDSPAQQRPHRSAEVRVVADWVARSNDHGSAPFLVVDKRNARLFVFDAEARMIASTPILLGAAHGDDSAPGIGERAMSEIQLHERTTPAGRFAGEAGSNLQGESIVWVDYDAAVSIHRVRATIAHQRRLQRLASATVSDNRISYGCINVPAAFFDSRVWPLYAHGRKAIIYVLPESRSLAEVFPAVGGLATARGR